MQLWIFTSLECFPFMVSGSHWMLGCFGSWRLMIPALMEFGMMPSFDNLYNRTDFEKTTVPCWILLGTCSTGVTVIIIEWWFFGALYSHLGLLSCSSFFAQGLSPPRQPASTRPTRLSVWLYECLYIVNSTMLNCHQRMISIANCLKSILAMKTAKEQNKDSIILIEKLWVIATTYI